MRPVSNTGVHFVVAITNRLHQQPVSREVVGEKADHRHGLFGGPYRSLMGFLFSHNRPEFIKLVIDPVIDSVGQRFTLPGNVLFLVLVAIATPRTAPVAIPATTPRIAFPVVIFLNHLRVAN